MTHSFTTRFTTLPARDRNLLLVLAAAALAALALGILGGLLTALARSGFLTVDPASGYRFLTVHGVSAFFYWLYLAQVALLLGFAAVEDEDGLAWRGAATTGGLLMLLGFGVSLTGAHIGTPPLYDGAPALLEEEPRTLLVFNLGYVLLGLGLMLLPVTAIATLMRPLRRAGKVRLSATGFALFVWAGFLIVTGFAALHAFVPGLLWAVGLADFPAVQTTNWHILFHNLHYLPLMATVLIWYLLMQVLTGAQSIFGARFSKIVFTMYLVFVPPTSLYHMFLDPNLPEAVKVTGSLLSLFVSVPTLTAFLIIIASLEVHARAQGARGLFGWIGMLPWRHPAMAAAGVAVISMGLGIVLAFVLIQEKLAPLLSDTFFVPGYFHFFTVGTVSLTLLAGLSVVVPALSGRALAWPGLVRLMPWLALAGLLLFGGAGVAAGYLGVPRRVIDVSYGGEAPALWQTLMAIVGIGGSLMALALMVFALGVAAALPPRRSAAPAQAALPVVFWQAPPPGTRSAAWTGPVAMLVIVLAMYGFTTLGFELMQALPVTAVGGAGH
ncbi:MAG: cbb3-type cytochrome c oxidase subunit I [Paracoccaceae bacterium]|nr:cbb3-type cytochrome c oxidase subunit I [Paracoccaceae bacterium]